MGINHLAAISGFHLGFLSFLLSCFLIISTDPCISVFSLQKPQQGCDASRLAYPLWLCGLFRIHPPSLLRAFGMMLIAFILYNRGLKLLSFSSLSVTVLLLLAFFPDLLFSLGFWLSVLGVFNLFLILKHFAHLKKWQLFFVLHFGVFILMLPWVVFIFGQISLCQLLSPLLSMLFILFYPASIAAVVLGFADVFDPMLLSLLSLDFESIKLGFSGWFMTIFVLLSLAAVVSRVSMYVALGMMVFLAYGLVGG